MELEIENNPPGKLIQDDAPSKYKDQISAICNILGIKTTLNVAQSLEECNAKLVHDLEEIGEDSIEPLLDKLLFSDEQIKRLEEINLQFSEEYRKIKLNMLKRLDDYFLIVKHKFPTEIKDNLQNERNKLSPVTSVTLNDLFHARDDLVLSSLDKTSLPLEVSMTPNDNDQENAKPDLKSSIFALRTEPPKPAKSKGKKKKAELKAKRAAQAESGKPVPKRDKNRKLKAQNKKKKEVQEEEVKEEEVQEEEVQEDVVQPPRVKKLLKAQKKKAKREARKQRKTIQNNPDVEEEDNSDEKDVGEKPVEDNAEKDVGEKPVEDNAEMDVGEELGVENNPEEKDIEDKSDDSDSDRRSEGEFVDSGSDEE